MGKPVERVVQRGQKAEEGSSQRSGNPEVRGLCPQQHRFRLEPLGTVTRPPG